MNVAKIAGQIIKRGLKSKYLLATKNLNDQCIMLFHNPKSGNSVVKMVDKMGFVNTWGYKNSRKVLSPSGKIYSFIDYIGKDTLKSHPESLALSYNPDKAINEIIIPEFRHKVIASKGKVTHYDDFMGSLFKSKVENQSMGEFVNMNPFM